MYIGGGYGEMGWNRMNYRGYMVVGGMGHALGFVFRCVA